MNYPKTVIYPEFFNELATLIGRKRHESNLDLHAAAPQYERGGKDDEYDSMGVLGELIIRLVVFNSGRNYSAPPILSSGPLGGPDITIGLMRLDVKTVLASARELQVNHRSHLKVSKSITHYCFVKILPNNRAEYWIFPYEDVSQWQVKDSTYSPIFFKLIHEPQGQVPQCLSLLHQAKP